MKGIPLGTKVQLDISRRQGIIVHEGSYMYGGERVDFYLVNLGHKHGDYMKNEKGEFGEIFISCVVVHESNLEERNIIKRVG